MRILSDLELYEDPNLPILAAWDEAGFPAGPGEDLAAFLPQDGLEFARDGSLVDGGATGDDRAVGADLFARMDHDQVVPFQLGHADALQR